MLTQHGLKRFPIWPVTDLPTQRIENPGQNHKFPWILLPFPGHYSFQYYNNNFFSFQKFIRDAYSILILSHGEYKT